jgi:hypothetical protein
LAPLAITGRCSVSTGRWGSRSTGRRQAAGAAGLTLDIASGEQVATQDRVGAVTGLLAVELAPEQQQRDVGGSRRGL